ncbi:hypothetical protein SAMN05444422_109156 [Halobiforma haloterrestris]|uniref:IclR helix-turn-helix domain-containing protein n=1 Tax=Natronobacterium haloterrestre TaxID=148448 RepID=A0A1I1JRC4_NATHA|nr:hypothetical protein [Halobiforma haloterrestris]SFC51104.1 hypothetical protein SAMN05444422_109156 [Halobiforma haloterrestris]
MNRPAFVGLLAFAILLVIAGLGGPAMATGGAGGDIASDAPSEPVADAQAHSFDRPQPTTAALESTEAEPAASAADFGGQTNIDSRNFDTTSFEITVYENGSARWTFRYEQRFSGDDAAEQRTNFEEFAAQFDPDSDADPDADSDGDGEDGSDGEVPPLYERFVNQAEAMTDTGAEATDRKMEATDFDRAAYVEEGLNPVGVVEMSFTWIGFAETVDSEDTDGDRIVVGDVFQGIYIAEDQSIVVQPGDDLEFRTVEPEGRYVGQSLENADSVSWTGEREFIDGRPRVVLESAGDGGSAGASTTPDSPPMSSVGGDNGSWLLTAGIAVAVVFGAAGAIVWYRRRSDGNTPDAPSSANSTTSGPDPTGTAEAGDAPPQATATESAGSTSASSGSDDATTEPLPDDELLTDEDRVVKLIRENGGRMKQVNIVEETGWSKSKVSMLLSDMEEEDTISKLRVGRENIISLEGFEPEATKSPFEE